MRPVAATAACKHFARPIWAASSNFGLTIIQKKYTFGKINII
jgi:hypothetical protein